VDNDAGGISVYTQAGAKYGYALAVVADPDDHRTIRHGRMCRAYGRHYRQGIVGLIRRIGFGPFFVMVTLFFVDLANVVAEFAVWRSMQIFGVSSNRCAIAARWSGRW